MSRSVGKRIDSDDVEELQTVADFELFEIVQTDTAFVAGGDFTDIFLEVLKRLDMTEIDKLFVTEDFAFGVDFHNAGLHAATADAASLGGLENLDDFGLAERRFARFGGELAFHGLIDLFEKFVDDGIQADIDAFADRKPGAGKTAKKGSVRSSSP